MKNLFLSLFTVLFTLVLTSCNNNPAQLVTYVEAPVGLNSSESSLYRSDDGSIYLSWIEADSLKNSTLLLSKLEQSNSWAAPTTIARGNDWFVNWADFPSISSFGKQNLVAHYLEKSAGGTYTYDVKLTISNDQGHNWGDGFKAHHDNTKSEHGFVSKVAIDEKSFLAVWLDGRQMAYAKNDTTIVSQMTLRGGVFNDEGIMQADYLLDDRVCECCQTDTAMTQEGPIVIYRNRSESEIRDIYYTRQVDGHWTAPEPLHNDSWKIEGCPVNGPAMSTKDNEVGIAWYTMANGLPSVKVIFSNNNGQTFNEPIKIDDIYPLGRVDIEMLNSGTALVSWLDRVNDETLIQLQRVHINGDKSDVITLTKSSESRSSGFPRMAIKNENAYISWTQVKNNTTTVKTAVINTALMH